VSPFKYLGGGFFLSYNSAIMIYYSTKASINLQQYGIEIPIPNDRTIKIVEELQEFAPYIFHIDHLESLNKKDLLMVHGEAYINRLLCDTPDDEIIACYELINEDGSYNRYNPSNRKKHFSQMVENHLFQTYMSYYSCKKALSSPQKMSYFLGGGHHHAQVSAPGGFCLLNDVSLTAVKLLDDRDNGVSKVWIIDIDAHKGDGTAAICFYHDNIKTLSIHMGEGWPLDQENPLHHVPSDIDIPIYAGEEESYLPQLEKGLDELLAFGKADIAIVVDGSDAFELDALASTSELKLSKEQMLKRNILVYKFLKDLNIPQAYLMSGGYGEQAYTIHTQFLKYVLSGS